MAPTLLIGKLLEFSVEAGLCRDRADDQAAGGYREMTEQDAGDISSRVWFRFVRLAARMEVAVTERLREIGLSLPQCDVLTTLTEQEGVSQQELAKRLYITKGNISGLLDRLEKAGLVQRRTIAADKRQYAIYLTASGRKAAESAIAVQRDLIAKSLGRLSRENLLAFENQLVATRDVIRTLEE
jgi:DNA-binding MarR family transcriptional regulator